MGNMPNIRFKHYTDDWEQRKLSEITTEKLSNGIMNHPSEENTDVKHINVINMYTADKIHIEDLTDSEYDDEAIKKCNVEIGDIFLTRSSVKPEGIAEANVLLDSGRFVFDDHLIRMKIDKNKYDALFVKICLGSPLIKRQFIMKSKTTAFTTIGQDDIASCDGIFPLLAEQRKISEFFSNLDNHITLHQHKCDESKELKKYMLQKMFPKNGKKQPEIRFNGFADDWEQRKLGDEAIEILAGGDIDKEKATEEGKYPIYANALTNDGIVGYYDDYYRVKAPAVTVTGRGEVGHAQARMTDFTPVVRLLAIRSNHDCYFLENAINNHKVIVESTGVPQLTVPQLSAYEIFFPSNIEEETKIGEYFHSLDNLITLHQRKCDEYKELKKYLLQNMFPQKG